MRRKTRPLSAFHGNMPDGLTGASECSNGRDISCQTSVRVNTAKPFVGPLRGKRRLDLRKHATTTSDHYFQRAPMLRLHKSLRLPNFFVPLHIRASSWHTTVGRRPKSNKNGNGRRMRHLFPTTYPTKYIYLCLKTIA